LLARLPWGPVFRGFHRASGMSHFGADKRIVPPLHRQKKQVASSCGSELHSRGRRHRVDLECRHVSAVLRPGERLSTFSFVLANPSGVTSEQISVFGTSRQAQASGVESAEVDAMEAIP